MARLVSKRWTGGMTVVVGDDEGNAVRCDLLRMSRRSNVAKLTGRDASFRAHSFELEITADEIGRHAPGVLQSAFALLAERLDAAFAAAARGRRWLHELTLPRGLESGLPGIFPMTAIGHPYVNELDLDAVVSSQVANIERLPNGAAAITVPDATLLEAAVPRLQESLRRQLGESYFCGPAPQGEWLQRGGQAGIGRFLFGLLRDAHADRAREAKRSLQLDYSGVFFDFK